jgi:DNA-binding transcriptional LysR family regulator
MAFEDPRRALPPLNALKAFEAVGRLGSVRRAAEALSVTHTVVSRHIRNLEDWVGIKLLTTGPRGIQLTPDGGRLLEGVSAAFDLIQSATESVRPCGRGGELRLWCVPGLAVRWLTPRLNQLQAALPDIEVVLRPTDAVPDLAKRDADVEIRFGQRIGPGIVSEELAQPRFFPVASPAFLAAHGPITSVADLVRMPLIHEESRQQWRAWLDLAGLDSVEQLPGPRVWYANVAAEAALTGQGIALTNRFLAEPDLGHGQLVELLQTDIRVGSYFLHATAERWNDPSIVKLRRWLSLALAD